MCGITGIVDYKGVQNHSVDTAMKLMAHRGPDATGVFKSDKCILGHLRLSIIDLTQGANQPMYSHCGRYVMVYNGEVFNFREISAEIRSKNPTFKPLTSSDSEIILEAFALWGVEFVHRLNGMFAIAIWDKTADVLYLFRDRVGIKPLYYYSNHSVFAFSSELKGLAGNTEIKRELTMDNCAINQFLHLGYIPAPNSIYQEIKKLQPGYFGVFNKNGFKVKPYWQIANKMQPDQLNDINQAKIELKLLLESSIKYRLISDVPLGTFLSGGIDSSLVTAVAQSIHPEPVNTFSIGFWDKGFDESGYASAVASYLGTNHQTLHVTEQDALEWMQSLNDIYDEPYADSSAIPTLLVSKMARSRVTVTLSGDGGDELFMGYGAYKWATRLQWPLVRIFSSPAAFLLNYGPRRYRRVATLFHKIKPEELKSHIFSQEQYLFSRSLIHDALLPAFRQSFHLNEYYTGAAGNLTHAEQQALFDFRYYLPDDLLVKVDRASMYFGLETRVPLLDYRIVEWAANLSPKLKIVNGEAKWLLKQVLFDLVPSRYFDRPKRGFAIPLGKWLKNELKGYVMSYLNAQSVKEAGVINPYFTEQLLNDFYRKDHFWLYNRLWQLVVLQKWLFEKRR